MLWTQTAPGSFVFLSGAKADLAADRKAGLIGTIFKYLVPGGAAAKSEKLF